MTLAGQLEHLELGALQQTLAVNRSTGKLMLTHGSGQAVLVFRGGRWRWGRGGWGGFIPHAGPGQGLCHAGGVEVDAGLAGSRPGSDA